MLTANTSGNTDVAALTGGAALQKDPFSVSSYIQKIVQKYKKKKFAKSSLAIKLSDVNTDPTPAQKEAGNYKKVHTIVHGLDITIENPKGSYRKGVDKSGKPWKCKMYSHYGYFKRTEGKDGDHVDCFIGPNVESEIVFIVNQNNSEGKFDEHKVMLGFNNEEDAKEGYLKNYSKGWEGCGSIVSMTIDQFKTWLQSEDTKKLAKPFSKSQLFTELEWMTYFEKGRVAQVGETRTWTDGTVHRKTADGKWEEVSTGRKPTQNQQPPSKSNSPSSQPKTHEQRVIDGIDRWKELEAKAKLKNKERMAKANPQNRNSLFDVSNARPGDVIRIERASSGRINRGHIGEVLDKVDGFLKVALASGGIYLFPPNELAFAKGGKKTMNKGLVIEFEKGAKAQVGEIREWSDGNKYRKEANGWKLVGSGDKKAHQIDSKEYSKKTGKDAKSHSAEVQKAMEKGEKIPVKVLRQFPELLKKFPVYKNRVKVIDAISRGMKGGSKAGGTVEDSMNAAKQGKSPVDNVIEKIQSIKKNKSENSSQKQKVIQALESKKKINLEQIPENTDTSPIELTPEEKKTIAKLTNNNYHTEALMVEAKKHPNPYYLNALKQIKKESDNLGHLASNLKETRDKIEKELRKKPVNGNDVLSI